ncbi:MAG TPA: hypothetical protein VL595_13515 [Pseudonocardia sp.]|nr:hypothetical protein [Pseudonocardia sp.]
MPTPPVDVPVDPTGQLIMTVAVLCGLAAVAVGGLRMCRSRGSAAPMIMLGGSLLAGFIEPLYCNAFHLWYYSVGQWSMYSTMGISQPVWSWLSYCPFYGGLTLLVWARIDKGAARRDVGRMAALLVAIGIVTEIVCITLGTYEYYGPHPFRVLNFPLWIAVANAVVGMVSGILAARLGPLLPGPRVWAYVALVPATMTMVQFGTGFLALDAINATNPPTWLLYGTATISMALAATVAMAALRLVPARARAGATDAGTGSGPAAGNGSLNGSGAGAGTGSGAHAVSG